MSANELPDAPKKFTGAIGLATVLLTLLAGGASLALLREIDRTSADSDSVTSSDGAKTKRGPEFWQAYQRHHELRTRLQRMDQCARRIFEEIETLEDYQLKYWELATELRCENDHRRLAENRCAVRYFWANDATDCGQPVLASDYRNNLETLMIPVRSALDDPTTAFQPSNESVQMLFEIERAVRGSRVIYQKHYRLMCAFTYMDLDQSAYEQRSMRASVHAMNYAHLLAEFGFVSTQADSGGGENRLVVNSAPLQLSIDAALLEAQNRLHHNVGSHRFLAGYP